MKYLVTTGILVAMTAAIFTIINREQAVPYMDEIFHIPQAQNYCHFHYDHWNEKITTLPGLYLASQIPLSIYSLGNMNKLKGYCTTYLLRLTNMIFIAGCYFIISRIYKVLKFSASEKSSDNDNEIVSDELYMLVHSNALVLTTFPLLYFFSFIYYTDVGCTFFILLGYYYSLLGWHVTSSLVACIAILFRQTSIIWVGFSAATSILSYLVNEAKNKKVTFERTQDILVLIGGCINGVLKICVPYVLVLLGFVVFVIKNNGIVVGDRSMHEASFNLPQIFYMSVFVMFFSSFCLTRYMDFNKIRSIVKGVSFKKFLFGIFLIGLMVIAIYKFTFVHKYLVADNRHYTFYVWRKLINRHWFTRYLLSPFYFISWLIIFNELSDSCNHLWILIFFGCCLFSLVPQKLLEFRYFIVPYLMFRLHIKTPNYLELVIEFLLYNLINGVTLYLFLYCPFYWPSDTSVQRFMW